MAAPTSGGGRQDQQPQPGWMDQMGPRKPRVAVPLPPVSLPREFLPKGKLAHGSERICIHTQGNCSQYWKVQSPGVSCTPAEVCKGSVRDRAMPPHVRCVCADRASGPPSCCPRHTQGVHVAGCQVTSRACHCCGLKTKWLSSGSQGETKPPGPGHPCWGTATYHLYPFLWMGKPRSKEGETTATSPLSP